MWQQGQYERLSHQDDARGLLGKMKLGQIDEVASLFGERTYPDLPDRAFPIQKALFLFGKQEYIGAEQLLSTATHPEVSIRAMYL